MRITLTERFRAAVLALPADAKARVFDLVLRRPAVLRNPGAHPGAGLRKLHPRGIWEARVGLDVRVVFGLGKDEIVFDLVGSHDDVRRYLRTR